jgi:serine/threonine protein kinase
LSKRIETSTGTSNQSKVFGVMPYVDPKQFNKSTQILTEKSDIYSVGVLLWEISSGHPPFQGDQYDISLVMEIIQGRREDPIPGTPEDYVKIYTGKFNV